MPTRGKRVIGDFDPNKSDSEDETYGASSSKLSRSRTGKSQTSKPSRKRQRRTYGGDESVDDEEISESELSVEQSEVPEEDEAVELGPSGRPKRRATQNTKPIIEDDDSEDFDDEGMHATDEEEETTRKRQGRQSKPSLVVKLAYQPGNSPIPTSTHPRRSERTRSASAPISRPTSSGLPTFSTRRVSRRNHGNADLVALATAGRHVNDVGRGIPNPREGFKRLPRGGKSIKKPAGLTENEGEEDENSGMVKDQQSTDELQKDHYRQEIAASLEDLAEEDAEPEDLVSQTELERAKPIADRQVAEDMAIIPESGEDNAMEEDDDDDPISQPRRNLRHRDSKVTAVSPDEALGRPSRRSQGTVLGKRKTRGSQKSAHQESSDFEPPAEEGEEEDLSDSEDSASPRKNSQDDAGFESSPARRGAKRRKANTRSRRVSNESEEQDELLEELDDLHPRQARRSKQLDILMENKYKTRRRRDNKVNYDIMASNAALARAIEENEDDMPAQNTPSKRGRAGGVGAYGRSLFSTYGPFGGAGAPPVLGGPSGLGALGGAVSDSSDDEIIQRPKPVGVSGPVGMTPTTTHPAGLGLFPGVAGQVHGADPAQAFSGTSTTNLGRIKDKQALADADPLGVDQNVNFDSVGGLQGHIDQLKEMVALPLLYPEVFQRFHVTPPRGVLFHGPPGTGKTLLARALASSVSSQGKKVTFYMRKGADALSKWVGEAERQLRLLFDEARKNQPSIIFFDEIDGLAPVRSSKQEQIHASIVSTLLALMDGMDGRGQVIVIGATNRPDSVDPALRRPGRFDREFYFPLPNMEARRSILDIHTKGWQPPLAPSFKDEIAKTTKGYGGADLRALCTEAALNAVQRRYPQIYKSNEKLLIKPETIHVTAKDFMISVKNMTPSSERSASSGAAPLPAHIEPLLRQSLKDLENQVAEVLPRKKRLTALQEAEFEDAEDDRSMKSERMQQEFERSRIFRPRLLIRGAPGMGQQYLAAALLNHLEGLHVQAFDLPTLLSDSTRSSEAAIVQLFTEVRRHKPSVIYIPNVNAWYATVGQAVISTFCGLLRSLAPTDPILLFGVLECEEEDIDVRMLKDLFGYSKRCQYNTVRPSGLARREYFNGIIDYIRTSPADFPDPVDRKKRTLEILVPASPEAPKEPPPLSKAELKAQKKRDRLLLNQLKIRIQPVMDHIKNKYRKFRLAVIDEKDIRYLFDEDDPAIVTSDLPQEQRQQEYRPFEKAFDGRGEPGLKESATGRFFYNLDVATIEKRLSNGYYKRAKDFLSDVKKLAKDAKTAGDEERLIKANELQTNVEVDMNTIETENPAFTAELENVYQREVKREKEMVEKAKREAAGQGRNLKTFTSNVPRHDLTASSTDMSSGPIRLGQPLTNGLVQHAITPSNPSILTNGFSSRISDLSDLQGHIQSNGTPVPSRGDGDVQMSNSDERSAEKDTQGVISFGPSAQTRPPDSYTGGPVSLGQRKSMPNSLTQGSAVTPMAPGSQLADYTNYASTTSSDNKRHTGSSGDKDTQTTKDGPDLSMFPECAEPNSQLPETVGNTQASQYSAHPHCNHSDPSSSQSQGLPLSQQEQRLSQTPAVPLFPRETSKTNISSLLNDTPAPSRPHPPTPSTANHPPLLIDKAYNAHLLETIVHLTSGSSIEQVEQAYSAMMNEIWKTRSEWNRGIVARSVKVRFDDVMEDIREYQHVGVGSMDLV
ncbi:MAG: hypothetical protein Q9163_003160 [Psora crenata]